MPEHVTICEVSPRDGLQNEAAFVATDNKVHLIDLLAAAGLRYIEAASFVSPNRVPQMADGAEVMARIDRKREVVYAALTPNLKGYEAARMAGADEVAIFASASETFSHRNINCTVEESLVRYRAVCEAARRDHTPVRGYVSCVVACPYEGPIAPEIVSRLAARLLDMGCREISLGDTIGVARPDQIERLLEAIQRNTPARALAGHFHDTHGRALACIRTSLQYGLRVFDASIAGAGGCPFAPGAPGNVSTESVAQLLADEGFETAVDMTKLATAATFMATLLGRPA